MATTATNVLLQYVSVHSTRYVDHNGNPTPFSVTVGSGQATLLRGGQSFAGTWSGRPRAPPTTWQTAAGTPFSPRPGQDLGRARPGRHPRRGHLIASISRGNDLRAPVL